MTSIDPDAVTPTRDAVRIIEALETRFAEARALAGHYRQALDQIANANYGGASRVAQQALRGTVARQLDPDNAASTRKP